MKTYRIVTFCTLALLSCGGDTVLELDRGPDTQPDASDQPPDSSPDVLHDPRSDSSADAQPAADVNTNPPDARESGNPLPHDSATDPIHDAGYDAWDGILLPPNCVQTWEDCDPAGKPCCASMMGCIPCGIGLDASTNPAPYRCCF